MHGGMHQARAPVHMTLFDPGHNNSALHVLSMHVVPVENHEVFKRPRLLCLTTVPCVHDAGIERATHLHE